MSAPSAPLAPDPALYRPLSTEARHRALLAFVESVQPRPATSEWRAAEIALVKAEFPEAFDRRVAMPSGTPLVQRGQLARLQGCLQGADGVLCVRLAGTRVRCRSCGSTTVVAADHAGPQLLECECGGGLLCAHPPGTPPPTPRALRRAAAERARQQLDELGPKAEPEKPASKARKAKPHRGASAGRRRRRARGSGS